MLRAKHILWAALICGCASAPREPLGVTTVHLRNGLTYLGQGQCRQAEEACRLSLEYGDDFKEGHNCLGLVELFCGGSLEEARVHFKAAIALDADFAEAHNNLGTTFFRETPPVYETAREAFASALEIDPGYVDARENLAMCLVRGGFVMKDPEARRLRLEEARSQLYRILEQRPGHTRALEQLGLIALDERDFAEAEDRLAACVRQDPEDAGCAYNLAQTYLETRRCERAIPQLVGIIHRSGALAVEARASLAVAAQQCALADAAVERHLEALAREPTSAARHDELARIYDAKGLHDRARSEWAAAVALEPSYCAAYFELAMAAHRDLDSAATIEACEAYVSCGPEEPVRVERCRALRRALLLE